MTPETISALVNMGSAGAVIAVVILFLKAMEKRDSSNQEFFKELRKTDDESTKRTVAAMGKMTESLNCLIDKFDDHDRNVEARITRIAEAGAYGRRRPGGIGGFKE